MTRHDRRAEPSLTVSADRDRLRQVFANLLDNAIKYTPAGGRVRDRRRGATGDAAIVDVDATPAPASPPNICRGSGSGSTVATPAAPNAAWAWA